MTSKTNAKIFIRVIIFCVAKVDVDPTYSYLFGRILLASILSNEIDIQMFILRNN